MNEGYFTNRPFVREEDISWRPNALSNAPESDVVNPLGPVKKNAPVVHVRSADERHTILNKFVRSRAVLPMVPILDKKDTTVLKLCNRNLGPITVHLQASASWR